MFTQIDGLKLYYERLGTGSPLLVLHGWGTDSRSMRRVAEYARDSLNAQAYVLDFPGFGLSDYPLSAWGVDDFAVLTGRFLDRFDIQQTTIIAHSFGGRVAIKLAATQPGRVHRLVLVDSAGIRPRRTLSYHYRVYSAKLARGAVRILPGPVADLISQRIVSQQGSPDYRSAGPMRPTFVKIVNEDLRDCLPVIKAPTLLVWGELDKETPLSDAMLMKEKIPDSRLVVIKGAGHFCYLDDFPAFTGALISFLGANA